MAFNFSHKSSNLMPNYLNNHVQGVNVNNTFSSRKDYSWSSTNSIVAHLFFESYKNDTFLFNNGVFFQQLYAYQIKPYKMKVI